MAQIDVTDLFTDPDFVDFIQVITRAASVNSFGENFIKETPFDSVGSVQPADYRTVKKLPESLQVENISSFWVKGPITVDQNCKYPSVIVFKGSRYQVLTVADWTNWGAGWSEGTCVAEKLS